MISDVNELLSESLLDNNLKTEKKGKLHKKTRERITTYDPGPLKL